MSTITIRRIEDDVKARLRVRAAHRGRSMEEEAREILKNALAQERPPDQNLAESIRKRFAPFGGVRLTLPKRDAMRGAPKLRP